MSSLSSGYLSERGVLEHTALAHGLEIDQMPEQARIVDRLGTDTIRGNSLSQSAAELLWCPIHDANGTTTLWTVRVFPIVPNNGIPKFITTIGHHAAPFIEPAVWNIANQVASPLILTEGPIKGMILSQAGALSIGLQGVWLAAQKNAKGIYDLIPELQIFQWTNRKIYFAFDADQSNNPQVLQALIRAAFLLFAQGAEILQLTNWPLAEGKGIDDYLASKAGLDPEKQKGVLMELTTNAKPFIDTLRPQMLSLVEGELKKVALSAAQFSQLCKRLSGPLKIKGSALKRGGAQAPVWISGQTNSAGIPQIRHPQDRLDSEIYQEIGQVVSPHYVWFRRGHDVQVIAQIPSGFIYSENPDEQLTVKAFSPGFLSLSPGQAKSDLEDYCEPICLEEKGGDYIEVRKSFSREFCAGMLESPQFRATLPLIVRILTVPLPFRIRDRLVYPKSGYDQQFGTFLMPDAPVLYPMTLAQAIKVINEKMLAGFGFSAPQSRINAIARLLTPFARGILGWTERVPIWFYCANRPRAGKDYLSGTTLVLYEGHAYEDQPIAPGDSTETAKRIIAANQSGRRFLHFSNCEGYLKDSALFQASTALVIRGRQLGSNAAAADLELPNEMEFSLSANVGMTARPDFEARILRIELEFFDEEANSRVFPDKYLHQTIKENRAEILSAIAAIYQNWARAGFSIGPTTHTSYPRWGDVIGGVMVAADLGDPCVAFKGKFEVGEDPKTALMREVFRVCREAFGAEKVRKAQIYEVIQKEAEPDNDQLKSICPLHLPSDPAMQATIDCSEINKNQKRLGYLLKEFDGRFLDGIELVTDKSSRVPNRYTYRFLKKGDPDPKPRYTASSPTAGETELPLDQKKQSPTPKNENLSDCRTCRTSTDPLEVLKEEKSVGLVGLVGFFPATLTRAEHAIREIGREENIVCTQVQAIGNSPPSPPSPTPPLAVALDLETYGEPQISGGKNPKIKPSKDALDPRKGKIRLLSMTTDSPVSASAPQIFDLSKGAIPDGFKELIATASPLVIHNALFDLRFLLTNQIAISSDIFCTLTAARLLSNGTNAENDLGNVLRRYLKIDLPKDQGSSDWGALFLTDSQLEYARNDVRYLLPLKAVLETELETARLTKIFELESALIPVVAQMENTGIAVDGARLRALLESTARRVTDMSAELHAGFSLRDLNLDSPSQLLAAFAKVGVPLPDTAESTLAETAHPLATLVLQYRGQVKFGATVFSLLEAAGVGRIMGRFNPLGAVSGRFSSSGPNLQNIPRGPLRECFIASSPEHRLVITDYSQMELRAAAVVANDQAMIRAFRAGLDFHVETAAAVLRKESGAVSKSARQLAKAVNFGFLYGQQAKGFCAYAKTSYGAELSFPEAIEIREHFFATYTGLATWHEHARQQADALVEGRTLLGRRILPNPNEKEEQQRWNRFQMGTNYVIQGSCADTLKLAMVRLPPVLPSSARLILTVHDELVLECLDEDANIVAAQTQQVMKEAFREVFGDTVPAEVDTRICQNWGQK
jgi:DNA polymerase I